MSDHAIPTTPKTTAFTTLMYAPCFHSVASGRCPDPKYTAD